MSKRIFNEKEIEYLLQNPNVKRCSEKSISYRKSFKIAAVRKWRVGIPPQEIFIQAGFNVNLIGNETPRNCLLRWRRIFRDKGTEGLLTDGRKRNSLGRPKTELQNDKEKIKYLEAKIAYLKAENDFLAKLRKKS